MPARSNRPASSTSPRRSRARRWSLRPFASAVAGLLRPLVAARSLTLAGGLLGAGVAVAGIAYGLQRGLPILLERAEQRQPLDASQLRVVFEAAPAWIPQSALDELGDQVRHSLAGRPSIATDALVGAHAALARSGWFERIEQVRRSGRGELLVTAEFRSPFALVRSRDLDHVVDSRGRRLPLAYAGDTERPPLPLVVNVRRPMPAEPGTAWSGEDVRAAINLARLIRDRPWFAAGAIEAIDARRFEQERVLELVGRSGTRILWGSDPEARSLAEMPPARKLECLDALWQVTRRLDDGSGRPLDLRLDAVTLAER